jgi:hypothetical protein
MIESFVDSNGINIWTTRTGEGYPVMLCNGGAGCRYTEFQFERVEEPRPSDGTVRACPDVQDAQALSESVDDIRGDEQPFVSS